MRRGGRAGTFSRFALQYRDKPDVGFFILSAVGVPSFAVRVSRLVYFAVSCLADSLACFESSPQSTVSSATSTSGTVNAVTMRGPGCAASALSTKFVKTVCRRACIVSHAVVLMRIRGCTW